MLIINGAAGSICSLSPFLRGEGWGEGLIPLERKGPSPLLSQPKSDYPTSADQYWPNSDKPEFGCPRGERERTEIAAPTVDTHCETAPAA
jgi:hypothetical protein